MNSIAPIFRAGNKKQGVPSGQLERTTGCQRCKRLMMDILAALFWIMIIASVVFSYTPGFTEFIYSNF